MSPRESAVESLLRLEVRKMGGMTEKLAPISAGVPDRLVILPGGRVFLIELKADTGRLRPIQEVWHARAAERGVEVIVLTGTQGVLKWIAQQKAAS